MTLYSLAAQPYFKLDLLWLKGLGGTAEQSGFSRSQCDAVSAVDLTFRRDRDAHCGVLRVASPVRYVLSIGAGRSLCSIGARVRQWALGVGASRAFDFRLLSLTGRIHRQRTVFRQLQSAKR